ncbi:hypothetical protein FKM82_027408 [Ascaphus truei]
MDLPSSASYLQHNVTGAPHQSILDSKSNSMKPTFFFMFTLSRETLASSLFHELPVSHSPDLVRASDFSVRVVGPKLRCGAESFCYSFSVRV